MCYNLFGWLPAPAIYGWICEMSGEGTKSRWGMWALCQTILLAIGFLLLAIFASKLTCCASGVEDEDDTYKAADKAELTEDEVEAQDEKPAPRYSDWMIGSRGIPVESQVTRSGVDLRLKRAASARSASLKKH